MPPRACPRDHAQMQEEHAASDSFSTRERERAQRVTHETCRLGQWRCFIPQQFSVLCHPGGEEPDGRGSVMELRKTGSPRKYAQPRLSNHCAQSGETIFMPEWSAYLSPR